jgi:hypothetical protein
MPALGNGMRIASERQTLNVVSVECTANGDWRLKKQGHGDKSGA